MSIASLIFLALVAFAIGFFPLQESAERAGISVPILVPILVDLGLVLMGLGAMAARSIQLASWPLRVMTGLLILVSAAVQYYHAISQPEVHFVDVIVAVLPPLVLWAASSSVEMLIFGNTVKDAIAKAEAEEQRRKDAEIARQNRKIEQAQRRSAPQPVGAPVLTAVPKKSAPAGVKTQGPVKIDDASLEEAIKRVAAGESLSSVARAYGIPRTTLGRKVDAALAGN